MLEYRLSEGVCLVRGVGWRGPILRLRLVIRVRVIPVLPKVSHCIVPRVLPVAHVVASGRLRRLEVANLGRVF